MTTESNFKPESVGILLFDLGGVIMDIDFDRVLDVWARCAHVAVTILRSRFSLDESYAQHERGEIDFSQYCSALRQSLQIDLSDRQFEEGWNAIFDGEISDARHHLARLSDNFPLYAFTNSNPTHQVVWEREYPEVLRLFRTVFVSSTLGLRKPEAAAFREIAQEVDVPLQQILFFDDTRENIVAAGKIGIQTVHVTGHQTLASVASLLLTG